MAASIPGWTFISSFVDGANSDLSSSSHGNAHCVSCAAVTALQNMHTAEPATRQVTGAMELRYDEMAVAHLATLVCGRSNEHVGCTDCYPSQTYCHQREGMDVSISVYHINHMIIFSWIYC